ncbi:hypothetical protein TNCT_63541 [Trichonephila clavata]|uniref:Uncharacterized protein n=1 Tax=Trichonephila clavata TaxID=2740835 RepID=A0A8X6K2A4_TRICU|nr:hypothetical protein TNCT_63541 [Trichonephila clavata]
MVKGNIGGMKILEGMAANNDIVVASRLSQNHLILPGIHAPVPSKGISRITSLRKSLLLVTMHNRIP